MAIDRSNIDFLNANMLYHFSSWDKLDKASVLANTATIESGGMVGCELDGSYNNALGSSAYRKIRLVLTFEPNERFNYTNDFLSINIFELYGANSISNVNQKTRTIAFTQDDLKDNKDGTYTLERIFPTENKVLQACEVYIINNMDTSIEVRDAGLYRSADINTDQVGEYVNVMQDSATPVGFKVYTGETDNYIDGLGIITASGVEVKFSKVMSGSRLSAILTNFAEPMPVLYIPEKIDLTTG